MVNFEVTDVIRRFLFTAGLALGLLAATGAASAQGAAAAQQAVDAYLQALSAGDVAAIGDLIGGDLRADSGHMFQDPAQYSAFLAERYDGVAMSVNALREDGDGYAADVTMQFPSGDSERFTFVLRNVEGQWKIVEEVL